MQNGTGIRTKIWNEYYLNKEDYLAALADPKNIYSHLETVSIESTTNEAEDKPIPDKAISVVILKAAGTRIEKPFFGVFKNTRFFRKNPKWELYVWYNEVIS